tara:strand:- start:794 stop:1702 length:909 start_codon:yes stop_codon:yes gene_type:complete
MQTGFYLPDTSSEDDYSSDDSGDLPKTHNIGVKYDVQRDYSEERFLDQSRKDKYFEIRNELFSKPLEHRRIFCKTHHLNMTITEDGSNITITHKDRGTIEISSDSHADALTSFGFSSGQTSVGGVLTGAGGFNARDFTGSTDKSLVVLIDGFRIEIPLTSNITTISEAVQILKYTLTTFKNTVNLNSRTNDIKNVIGFELVRAVGINNTTHTHYVDIKVPEIPHMACKLNENGNAIIDRVFLYNDITNYFINEPVSTEKNYFTPIVLNEFTIQLFDQNGSEIELEVVLEFEITILKQSLSQR